MSEDKVYLKHILEAIEKIEEYLTKVSGFEEFEKNDMVLDAVTRELEIIGEAANNLTEQFQENNSRVPWREMIAMRNKLIHEYFGVDKKIVWMTCKKRLPELKKQVKYFV